METQIKQELENCIDMFIIHQKRKHKELTPEQLKQYLKKEYAIESASYPYNRIERHIVIEGLVAYKKPVLEIKTIEGNTILQAFKTADELVDAVNNLYSKNKQALVLQ